MVKVGIPRSIGGEGPKSLESAIPSLRILSMRIDRRSFVLVPSTGEVDRPRSAPARPAPETGRDL